MGDDDDVAALSALRPLATASPGIGTIATHAGQEPEQWKALSVVPQISLSTTFKQYTPGEPEMYEYSRSGNPTRNVFETCIAALEGAKHGIAGSSGMGTTAHICQLLKTGDHIIAMSDCYGGTYRYFSNVLINYGVEVTYIDTTDLDLLEKSIKDTTKMIWLESLTNPLLAFTDLEAAVAIARKGKRKEDILVIVDNTFMSPYYFRPLEKGADIVYHSVTKYLNGNVTIIINIKNTKSISPLYTGRLYACMSWVK